MRNHSMKPHTHRHSHKRCQNEYMTSPHHFLLVWNTKGFSSSEQPSCSSGSLSLKHCIRTSTKGRSFAWRTSPTLKPSYSSAYIHSTQPHTLPIRTAVSHSSSPPPSNPLQSSKHWRVLGFTIHLQIDRANGAWQLGTLSALDLAEQYKRTV